LLLLRSQHLKVLNAIQRCRTAALARKHRALSIEVFPLAVVLFTTCQKDCFTALAREGIVPKTTIRREQKLAGQISLKQLTPAVDQAVKAALERHKTAATNGFALSPGIIAGPILAATVDVKVAQQIATEVTQQVQRAQAAGGGPALEPAVLIAHNHIICGFFPFPVPDVFVE
jgi:hypothetical protein